MHGWLEGAVVAVVVEGHGGQDGWLKGVGGQGRALDGLLC